MYKQCQHCGNDIDVGDLVCKYCGHEIEDTRPIPITQKKDVPSSQTGFITLTCPTCGGRLQIGDGIDRFVCMHCRNEHIVRRQGGAITVEPIVEELGKVVKGVDRTAAELAIKRIIDEIDQLKHKREEYLNTWESHIDELKTKRAELELGSGCFERLVWWAATFSVFAFLTALSWRPLIETQREFGGNSLSGATIPFVLIGLTIIMPFIVVAMDPRTRLKNSPLISDIGHEITEAKHECRSGLEQFDHKISLKQQELEYYQDVVAVKQQPKLVER